MSQMYFDVWPADDLNGTALGELTQVKDKAIRVADQAIGAGSFTINRHSSQFVDGWVERDNLVRVRLVPGGPFDYDDERYIHAFFISDGDDTVVSPAEEGGEDITRGGPSAIAILARAVVDYHAEVAASDKYWRTALSKGHVEFLERNPGEVFRILLRNAGLRTPNPLAPSTHHFSGDGNSTAGRDSSGTLWSDSDAVWQIPVGLDHLEVLKILSATQMWWKMPADLGLLAYDNDPGTDVSATVIFEKGVNIREAAEREVHTRLAISDALVEGSLKDGGKTFRWVHDGPTETLLDGRREGFVEYQATPTAARLDRAGAQAISERRTEYEGPTTLGVIDLEGMTAFVDYLPGDTVTVDVPGIFDELETKVFAIVLNELANGEYDVSIELEQVPFDGLTQTALESPCGKCPPSTPYVPSTQEGDDPPPADFDCQGCNTVVGGGNRNGFCDPGAAVSGQTYTYRVTRSVHDPLAIIDAWDIRVGGTPVAIGTSLTSSVSGTFVAPATDDIHFHFHANYNPGTVGANECATIEIWNGDVDLAGGPPVVRPPDTGQRVTGETPAVSIGSTTTTLTLDWPYAAGSLRIRVDGVLISPASYVETTPGSGVVTLSWALDADETVTVDYQAAT